MAAKSCIQVLAGGSEPLLQNTKRWGLQLQGIAGAVLVGAAHDTGELRLAHLPGGNGTGQILSFNPVDKFLDSGVVDLIGGVANNHDANCCD